jgi:hypothetical protein
MSSNNIKEELRILTGIEDTAKKDLFAFADANNGKLKEQFEKLVSEFKKNSKEKSLELLMNLIKEWGLTINMGWKKVTWVCDNGRMCTTYDIAKSKSHSEQKGFEVALKEVCNSYYDLRIEFHKEIKNEELFKYTAFNIGNLGLQSFGEFCFYFENKIVQSLSVIVFIKENSLDNYTDNHNHIEIGKLLEDICTIKLIKELVTVKHSKDIQDEIAEKDWPNKICDDDCYIEGVVIDELKLSEVQYVGIEKTLDKQYEKISMDLKYNLPVSTIDADMANNYLIAKDKLEKAGVNIKIM